MGLVATVLGLLLLNVAAIGYEYLQHGTIRVLGQPLGLYVEDKKGQGHQLRPGVRLDGLGHELAVNSLGFRGPELAAVKGPKMVRVWCAGGSTTFDICVSRDATAWPAQLQRRLAAATPGVQVEVINAGVPGEVLATNLRDFQRLAHRLDPDVLVIYQGPNDLRRIANQKFGHELVQASWFTQLALFRVIGDLLPPPAPPPEWAANLLGPADMALFGQQVQPLIDAARQRGTRVVLASHAFAAAADATASDALSLMGRNSHTYRMTPRGLIAAYEAANQLLKQMAARQGLTFVEVRSAVGVNPDHWVDGIHFSDSGAEVMGRVISAALVRAGLNKPRSPATGQESAGGGQ